MVDPRLQGFRVALQQVVVDPIRSGKMGADEAGKRLDRAEQAFRELADKLIEEAKPTDVH